MGLIDERLTILREELGFVKGAKVLYQGGVHFLEEDLHTEEEHIFAAIGTRDKVDIDQLVTREMLLNAYDTGEDHDLGELRLAILELLR